MRRAGTRPRGPSYKCIHRNLFVSRPRIYSETPVCQCDPSSMCGEQCINRLMQVLCHARTCPCGPRCTNISFDKRPAPPLDVVDVGARGFGLVTPMPLHKGQYLGQYCGELIDMAEARRRVRQVYARSKNYYFLEYDAAAGEVLDAGLCGSKLRFVNHSCEPNCYFEKWLLSGSEEDRNAEYQLGLFALRDIDAGEELTYNYGWTAFQAPHVDQHGQWVLGERCLCGTPSCTGWLARPPKKRGLLARSAPAEVTTAPPIPARVSEPVRTREARAQRRIARLAPNRAAPPPKDASNPPAVRHSLRTRRTPSTEPVQVQERLRTRATASAMATTHPTWAPPSFDDEASDDPRHDAKVTPPSRKRGWPKGRPRPRKKRRGWPKGRPRKIEPPPSETPTLGSSEPPDTSPEPEPLTPLVLLFEPESPVLSHAGVPYAWDVPLFVPADEASAATPCAP